MHKVSEWVGRYWMYLAVIGMLVLAFGASASALAAPPSSAKYQTVPKPTPTSEGDQSVPTATPRPDDDDDDESSDDTGGTTPVQSEQEEVPVFVIEGGTAPTAGLTASVTVARLNLREGPGTSFAVVGALLTGDAVDVLWRNQDSTWLYVCCIPETEIGGWASAQLLTLNFDRAAIADLVPEYQTGDALSAATTSTGAPAVGQQSVTAASAADSANPGALPVGLEVSLSPPYLVQGQTGSLLLSISNPNSEEIVGIELSDQLPVQLELIDATASGDGAIDEQTASEGASLIIASWESIPAGMDVELSMTVRVASDVPDGAVFDNLAAIQGTNAAYTAGSITVGMPPAMLPDFD